MKLSKKQKEALSIMRKHSNEMIMYNGWMTGGHGIRIDKRTINSLKNKGLIFNGKLTIEGKILTI